MRNFHLALTIPGVIFGDILAQIFGFGLGSLLFLLAYIASLIIFVRVMD